RPPTSTTFPYTPLFRSHRVRVGHLQAPEEGDLLPLARMGPADRQHADHHLRRVIALHERPRIMRNAVAIERRPEGAPGQFAHIRSEEHTSELQSRENLV